MKPPKLGFVIAGAFGLVAIGSPFLVHQWKVKSDRQECLMNIRSIQQGMRGHMGTHNHNPGEIVLEFSRRSLIGPKGFFDKEPTCRAGGTYTWIEGRYTEWGELMLRCSIPDHVPEDYSNW